MDDFEGPRSPVETVLSRLKRDGELVHLRKGLYFKGVRSRFGPGRPRTEEVVYKICGTKGVGPTGWTASRSLGLSTQVPARDEFALIGAPPTNVPGVIFHTRKNLTRLELDPPEIAVLETLRTWPNYSEVTWDDLVKRIAELRCDGTIRLERLTKVAARERSPKVRELIHALTSELEAESA